MEFDEQTIFRFFSLFEIPEGHDFLLWVSHKETQEKRSLFVQTAEAAVNALLPYTEWNCYYGVGLRPHQGQPRPHWRGTETDVTVLLFLHLDIDIFHAIAHKSTSLPKTHEEVNALLLSLPIIPSIRTDSGYGEHALYAPKEPELILEAQERNIARDAARQLHAAAYHVARMSGWRVDATFDLSRVLRIPGTINWKVPESPVLAKLISDDGPRYGSVTDLADSLPYTAPIYDRQGAVSEQIVSVVQNLRLTGGNMSPTQSDKFAGLMANDNKFKLTWEHKRTDLRDGSYSALDFSIMLQALNAGLSAQEVLTLVESFRIKHGAKQKDLGYYKFSIRNALLQLSQGKSEKIALESIQEREEQAANDAIEREQKTQDQYDTGPLFRALEIFLEFPPEYMIDHVLRIESEPMQHVIVVNCPDRNQRRIQIDSPDEALNWTKIKSRVLQVTATIIMKGGTKAQDDRIKKQWYAYFNRLRDIAIDYKAPESFSVEYIRELLEQYSETKSSQTVEDNEDRMILWMSQYLPFFDKNKFWFSLNKFKIFSDRRLTKPCPIAHYVRILHQIGAEKVVRTFRVDDGTSRTRNYWYIALTPLKQKLTLVAPSISSSQDVTTEIEQGMSMTKH